MAINRFQALNSLDFSGSNQLRQAAAEQIKQGLAQGQGAFKQFNTNLTNNATQQGLNQIRNLDSRDDVLATPLSSITPTYANQSTLQAAYDANKTKQQGLYEDDMMQQGLAKIHGMQSLDEYGKTSADAILSQFGQGLSAAKKTRLLGEYNAQDDVIKQQMVADRQWNQQEQTVAEKPVVDALGVDIQSSTLGNMAQTLAKINSSDISDATKSALANQLKQRAVTNQNVINSQRDEKTYQAQQTLNKFGAENHQQTITAKNNYLDTALKQGIPLTQNGELDTTNMTPDDIVVAQDRLQPLQAAFEKATRNTQEFNDFLAGYEGVEGFTPDMLTKAKETYKTTQNNLETLSPELQQQYTEEMSIYNAGIDNKIDTIKMQQANAVQNYQDVSSTTNKELNMTKGDAVQATRTLLRNQGIEMDQNDMGDSMDTLVKNTALTKAEPYVMLEVAKALQVEIPFWSSFDDKDFSDADITKRVGEIIVEARKKKARVQQYLTDKEKWGTQIIDLNGSKLQKSKELTAKLRLKNPKLTQKLYNKR